MTGKIFYKSPFLLSYETEILKILEEGIILKDTIAYPEGGGQVGDIGKIIKLNDNKEINFFDTKKLKGRKIKINDFPNIEVENEILHYVDNVKNNNFFKVGDRVKIEVDKQRRAMATLNHTGIHLVLMALNEVRKEDLSLRIYGAKISEKSARLDFKLDEKFTQEELKEVYEKVMKLANENKEIKLYSHSEEKEAIYWECNGYVIPCGGTHFLNTGIIKDFKLKRRTLGSQAERVIATFEPSKDFGKFYYD